MIIFALSSFCLPAQLCIWGIDIKYSNETPSCMYKKVQGEGASNLFWESRDRINRGQDIGAEC